MRLTVPLLALALAAAAPAPTVAPVSRMDDPAWAARHAAKLAALAARPPRLVFYGDSITQNWEKSGGPAWDDFAPAWRRFYGGRDAINLGFSGDTTQNLLWRIEHGEASGIDPRVAVVLIGVNDLGGAHHTVDQTEAGIVAVVDALRARLPHTRIVLLAVLPNRWSARIAAETTALDARLAAIDWRAKGVTYRDLGAVLMRDGKLDDADFEDPRFTPPQPPLHPTAEAQARLAAALEPTLAGLLGRK